MPVYVNVKRGGCTLVNMLYVVSFAFFVSLAFMVIVLTGNLLQTYEKASL